MSHDSLMVWLCISSVMFVIGLLLAVTPLWKMGVALMLVSYVVALYQMATADDGIARNVN